MGIQSFVPSSGGGMPGASFIASIKMTTYNRSWTQAGGPGDYVLVSQNHSAGYAYFVYGGSSVGVPLGKVVNMPSGFTRIDIVAPQNDYIILYKVATKSTNIFSNPLANIPASSHDSLVQGIGFIANVSIIRASASPGFTMPENAAPLGNILVVGAGGKGIHHGGGGGGGGVVKLTGFPLATTNITIGAGSTNSSQGGATYFGSVYALGGGSQTNSSSGGGGSGANGAGASSHNGSTYSGGSGTVQTSGTGLGTTGSPLYYGGFSGGNAKSIDSSHHVGGAGGGAGGAGDSAINKRGGTTGGMGHYSDITGVAAYYGAGGSGSDHHSNSASGNANPTYAHGTLTSYGFGGASYYNSDGPADNGAVIVRYYTI